MRIAISNFLGEEGQHFEISQTGVRGELSYLVFREITTVHEGKGEGSANRHEISHTFERGGPFYEISLRGGVVRDLFEISQTFLRDEGL